MFCKRQHAELCAVLGKMAELIGSATLVLNTNLSHMENRIMSALSDAVTRITNSTKTEIAAVIAALNAPNPDVDAAVSALNSLSDSLDAETAALAPASAGAAQPTA